MPSATAELGIRDTHVDLFEALVWEFVCKEATHRWLITRLADPSALTWHEEKYGKVRHVCFDPALETLVHDFLAGYAHLIWPVSARRRHHLDDGCPVNSGRHLKIIKSVGSCIRFYELRVPTTWERLVHSRLGHYMRRYMKELLAASHGRFITDGRSIILRFRQLVATPRTGTDESNGLGQTRRATDASNNDPEIPDEPDGMHDWSDSEGRVKQEETSSIGSETIKDEAAIDADPQDGHESPGHQHRPLALRHRAPHEQTGS